MRHEVITEKTPTEYTSRNTRNAMITLTRITEPAKLQEYYQFRYRIYNESKLKVMANEADGTDRDEYDDRAHHFGWYVEGKLAGCVRFVEPDASTATIPMLSYLVDAEGVAAVRAYMAQRIKCGQPMIEASRFCLAPAFRGLRTAREFVLAMVATMQPLGVEHGLFDVRAEHASFYRLLGFQHVGLQAAYPVPALGMTWSIFQYDFRELVGRNKQLFERMGFTQVRKAA
jgi:N-acyl-L-homoserine lactone synthetase